MTPTRRPAWRSSLIFSRKRKGELRLVPLPVLPERVADKSSHRAAFAVRLLAEPVIVLGQLDRNLRGRCHPQQIITTMNVATS